MNREKFIYIILLILATIIWGAGYPLQKILNEDYGVQEFFLVGSRFTIGGLFLMLCFKNNIKNITKTEFKWSFLLAAILSGGFIFQTYGLNNTSPTNNAFITSLYVVLIPFIMLFMKQKIKFKSVISSIVALTGCLILSFSGVTEGQSFVGDALTFICAILYAMHIISAGYVIRTKDCRPMAIGVLQLIITGVICLTMAFLIPTQDNAAYIEQLKNLDILKIFLFLGIFNCAYGFTVQLLVQRVLDSSNVGVIVSFEAVFAAIFGILIYNDSISPQLIIGGVLLMTAVLITELDINKVFKRKKRFKVT